jgi:outer membrane protein assembly factor BamD (BamD/ComL family)
MRKDLQKRVILSLGIFVLLFLSSCGWSKREQIQRQVDHAAWQAQMELEAGKFQRAIVIYREVYQKYPQDPTVRSGYIKTLESIKRGGDRAFERSNFALAGCTYEIVLKHVSSLTRLNASLSFNRGCLTAKIKRCKKLLFENGLKQYRSGNLDKAISIWKSILVFDPENQEIKKVVDMATLQLRNLQKAK